MQRRERLQFGLFAVFLSLEESVSINNCSDTVCGRDTCVIHACRTTLRLAVTFPLQRDELDLIPVWRPLGKALFRDKIQSIGSRCYSINFGDKLHCYMSFRGFQLAASASLVKHPPALSKHSVRNVCTPVVRVSKQLRLRSR